MNIQSAKYNQLINLLNQFEYKINDLSAFRIYNTDYSKIIENSQLCTIEKYLEIELRELSQMFDVSEKSSIILCSMFFNSFTDKDGLASRIVSEEDLMSSVGLEKHIIWNLQNAISELENKNIIIANTPNDSSEKSYSLTGDFINTITKL